MRPLKLFAPQVPRGYCQHLVWGHPMKSRILLVLGVVLLGTIPAANAVVICFDYVLYRAAQNAGIAACDPNPPGVSTYLSASELKIRLRLLGYELVSGPDPLTFGGQVFNTPGFAESFVKNDDVIFMRDEHVGYVNNTLTPNNPLIDHYIQNPNEIRSSKSYPTDHLPASAVTQLNSNDVHYGFWQNDPVREFLHNRTVAQGGGVEVWRLTRNTDANARQWACAAPNPSELILRLKSADATCEVKWMSKTPDLNTSATCRSTIDGPAATNSAQLLVAADGSGPGITVEASWEGFQNLKWGWTARVAFATFQGQGEAKCKGSDGRCTLSILARPRGTGPAVGREYVGAYIYWDGTGPGNPGVGPPNGIGVSSLQIEQGIDYRPVSK